MSTVAKILVVLNLGLAAAFLGSASNYLAWQETYRVKLSQEEARHAQTRKDAEASRNELLARVTLLSGQLTEAQNQKSVAETARQNLEAENKNLKEIFAQLAGDLDRAQKSIESMTKTIDSNRTLIDNLNAALNELRENLRSAQSDRDAAIEMVNSLQLQLQRETEKGRDLEAKLADLSEHNKRIAFELNWFKERNPGATSVVQPPHDGRILAADGARNVYVISLGEEDGVLPGFQYIVSRGDEYVGTIQIDNVQAKQAAGFAIKGMSKGEIRKGDRVINGR